MQPEAGRLGAGRVRKTSGGGRLERPRRLVLLVAVMTLGPLVIVGVAALRLSSDAAARQARRQVASAAAASAVAVQREMGGLADLVASIAERPGLRAAVGTAQPDVVALRSHLADLRRSRADIHLAFLTDPRGRLVEIIPSTPSIVGEDFSHRDWYRGVGAAAGRPYISEVYETAAAGGGLVVAAAAPVRPPGDPDGPPTAILVAGYRTATIQRFVDAFSAAQHVSITITDQRGVVVASPGVPSGQLVSLRDDADVATALAGRSSIAERSKDGEEMISASAPIPGVGWALVADQPASVALGEAAGLRIAVVVLVTGLGVALVVGLALVDRLLRRRAAAEEERHRSEAFLDSVIENIPNPVLVKDAADLRFVRSNRAAEELLGYRRDELLGRTDHDVFAADEADRFVAEDREALDFGRLVDVPAEPIRTRAADERWLHTRRIPIVGDDGRPRYLLVLSEDVTERREAEVALEEARRAADRANRAKNQFLSRMSHELRTPLNSVLGFGQLLELDELRPDQRDSVHQILRAGSHLLELIDEVLDISRMESGHMRLSLEPVRVGDVVGEAIAMVRPLASERRVLLVDAIGCRVQQHVRADRQRLRQVIVNLLSNAVKYNREEGEVSVRCDAATPGRVRVIVADTGLGLAEQDLARLFQPFERLGAEHSGVDGTGLGLVLTKQLVEVMGGTVGVTSELGVGTAFTVELPAADEPWGQENAAAAAPEPPVPLGTGARTVLYVEDNLSNVRLVERVVARRPEVSLLVAMQGSLAVELARQHRPNLVLLDLHLPDMAGEEVLRRLKSDDRTAAIPVVVLSADATPGQVERLLRMGAAEYLTKPFDIPRLLQLLDGIPPAAPDAPPDEPSNGDDGVLDDATVKSLRELGRDSPRGRSAVQDAVYTFLDEGASRLALLREAAEEADADAVERLAHSLAGSSAAFGAKRMADRCRELEAQARAGDLGAAPSAVVSLHDLFAEAAAELREEFCAERTEPAP